MNPTSTTAIGVATSRPQPTRTKTIIRNLPIRDLLGKLLYWAWCHCVFTYHVNHLNTATHWLRATKIAGFLYEAISSWKILKWKNSLYPHKRWFFFEYLCVAFMSSLYTWFKSYENHHIHRKGSRHELVNL